MNKQLLTTKSLPGERSWPFNTSQYDRNPALTKSERRGLAAAMRLREIGDNWWLRKNYTTLARLLPPIYDVLDYMEVKSASYYPGVTTVLLREMHERGTCYWSWSNDVWVNIFGATRHIFQAKYSYDECRCLTMGFAYIVVGFSDYHRCGTVFVYNLARRVFGARNVDNAVETVRSELRSIGYADTWKIKRIHNITCKALLMSRSPLLKDITLETLHEVRSRSNKTIRPDTVGLSRALVNLGHIQKPVDPLTGRRMRDEDVATSGVPPEWLKWCNRWLDTTATGPVGRRGYYYSLLKAGKWINQKRPDLASPKAWGYEEAAEYVADIARSKVGDWMARSRAFKHKLGQPLRPAAIANNLAAMRAFFRDCHEWHWVERRFDPARAFSTPRNIRAMLAPAPRVIANDIWAKLVWAGLNLVENDLPVSLMPVMHGKPGLFYPLTFVRAVAMVWLFAGLRSDEILRLRVGCVRWQKDDVVIFGTGEILPKDAVCWLDVPVNKTNHAFTKPVDRPVGEAIEAWERQRPEQIAALDPKTGEMVNYLFSLRGKRLGQPYINRHLIPILCKKAGVPESDAKGQITSHRARSTIASQLFNSKEPLSLHDLQMWLGHKFPSSTQYYAEVSPTKLAKKYAEAGYFERNLRTVEVLIDRDVIVSGAAARGEPWQFYDLGHGWCTNAYFVECPHRMACAKCNFYQPKDSTQAQLLEGRANLLRMRQEIPLTEEEVAAVDDDVEALEKLLKRLADVPTPAGPTPRQLVQITRASKGYS